MQNKNNLNNILSNVAYQLLTGVVYGYGIYFLTNKGLSASTAGFCLSAYSLVSLLVESLTSNYLDNNDKYDAFDAAVLFSIVSLILFTLLAICPKNDVLISILFILAVSVCISNEPLINSFTMFMNAKGIEVDFGKARACGSIGYALICAVFGILTNKYSIRAVSYGFIVFSIVQTIILLIARNDYRSVKIQPIKKEKQDSISFIEFFKNNTYFLILCIFLIGIFFGYLGVDNFMISVAENVGGTSKDMGIILAFKATLEFFMIFFYSKIRKKINLKTMLIIAATGFTLKCLAIVFAKSVLDLYLAQLLQMFGFAIIIPAMVEYVEQNIKPNEVNRGQACFTMAILVSGTIANYTLGLIINARGVKAMEIFSLVVSTISSIGFVITLLCKKVNE